jgi:hypothetical protein
LSSDDASTPIANQYSQQQSPDRTRTTAASAASVSQSQQDYWDSQQATNVAAYAAGQAIFAAMEERRSTQAEEDAPNLDRKPAALPAEVLAQATQDSEEDAEAAAADTTSDDAKPASTDRPDHVAFARTTVPPTISVTSTQPLRYVDNVSRIDPNCPSQYRLKTGATRPGWWSPTKEACLYQCYLCGSLDIAQEDMHDVNPLCFLCKEQLRNQNEERDHQLALELDAQPDSDSDDSSLFGSDTEATSVCTQRNEPIEFNYTRATICSKCHQPHADGRGCQPGDLSRRERIFQDDLVRYANTDIPDDPLHGHYGTVCSPTTTKDDPFFYERRYLVYFKELQKHHSVHFKYLAKVDFDPFGTSCIGSKPKFDEDGDPIEYEPSKEVEVRVARRDDDSLAPVASSRVVDPDGQPILQSIKVMYVKLDSKCKCTRCGHEDIRHRLTVYRPGEDYSPKGSGVLSTA